MKFILVTKGPFPNGMANTNRIISFTSEMVNEGNNVTILCISPTEHNLSIKNHETKGVFQGVKFLYTSGSTLISKTIFSRIFNRQKGVFNALKYILSSDKTDVLIMGVSGNVTTLLFYIVTRIKKIKFIQERSEYPFIGVKSIISKLNLFVYLNFIVKLFDTILVITKSLEKYFGRYTAKNKPIYLFQMFVETNRFTNIKKDDIKRKHLAYCGDMSGNKDGIAGLIESFAIISVKHKNIDLHLIGSVKFPEYKSIKARIKELKLETRIHFIGRVERDKIPQLLINAYALVLARPSNKQAEGGFPTKLGEYLATGNPVIVTKVGEISEYLTHKQNAYLSDPDNINAFAEKMNQAIENPIEAKIIGENGQKLALSVFNSKIQTKKLINFINQLLKK